MTKVTETPAAPLSAPELDKLEALLKAAGSTTRTQLIARDELQGLCSFTTLAALIAQARLAAQPEPECAMCNDSGIVGFPPDQYEDCPNCVKARAALAAPVAAQPARNETRLHLWWRQDHAEWRECFPDAPGAVEFVGFVPADYSGALRPAPVAAQADTTEPSAGIAADVHSQDTRHPVQPLLIDAHGRLRFKRNAIVDHLANGKLNDLAAMEFLQEDWEQLAQLIGYSLDGFGTLSYVTDETYDRAAAQVESASTTSAGEADTTASVSVPAAGAVQQPVALAHGHRDDYFLMANARRLAATSVRVMTNTTNWHFAAQLFATGSNSAHQICVDAGIDPYGYTVERRAAPAPENTKKEPPCGS